MMKIYDFKEKCFQECYSISFEKTYKTKFLLNQ